jgi:hypothetical protein
MPNSSKVQSRQKVHEEKVKFHAKQAVRVTMPGVRRGAHIKYSASIHECYKQKHGVS